MIILMKIWDINMNNVVLWLRRRILSPDIQDDMAATVSGAVHLLRVHGYRSVNMYYDAIMKLSVQNFINHWEELYDAEDKGPIEYYVYGVISDKYGDYIRSKFSR